MRPSVGFRGRALLDPLQLSSDTPTYRYKQAIARAHRIAGHASPAADPAVMTVLEGIARVHGSAPHKKTALLRSLAASPLRRVSEPVPGPRAASLVVRLRRACSVQAISKHLKVLEHAGLITRGRTAQLRPSRLEGKPLQEATEWLEQYRQTWEGRLDRLTLHLDDMQRKANSDD